MDLSTKTIGGALLLAAALGSLTGCSSIQYMEVRDDLAIYREKHPLPQGPAASTAAPMRLAVASTPNLTAQISPNAKVEQGALTWVLAPLQGDSAPPGMTLGLVIRGGGQIVAQSLADHTRANYPGWSADLVPPSSGTPAADVVVVPESIQILPSHQIRVTLKATLKDGRVIEATGMGEPQSTAGHLGWAIPCAIIFFPIGLTWIGPTVRAIGNGVDEKKYAEGVELASVDLLTQLAAVRPAVARR